MAEAGTVAVLLPGAYYFMRETKLPPVGAMRRHGTRIALATDNNPGTSPTTSLLLMPNMGAPLFGLTVVEALRGVPVNRSESRRVGKECVSTCKSRGSPYHYKKTQRHNTP